MAREDQILRELGIAPGKKRRRQRRKTLIGVVACSDKKVDPASLGQKKLPARVLYSASSFFNLASAYVQAVADHWIILSAKHGAVLPDQLLADYNQRLPRGGDEAWAAKVRKQLRSMFDNRTRFLVVTGNDYQAHLFTPESGFDYDNPLQHIRVPKGKRRGIGYQRGWLRSELDKLGT
jgi:hypothetical protein